MFCELALCPPAPLHLLHQPHGAARQRYPMHHRFGSAPSRFGNGRREEHKERLEGSVMVVTKGEMGQVRLMVKASGSNVT